MMDKPDVNVSLRHNGGPGEDPPDNKRYLKARGRDVEIAEFEIDYMVSTRLLFATGGGSRVDGATERLAVKAYDVLSAHTYAQRQEGVEGDVELNAGQLAQEAGFLPTKPGGFTRGRDEAVRRGWLVMRKDGTSRLYRLGDVVPPSRGGEVGPS
jgi:hypothetical protein